MLLQHKARKVLMASVETKPLFLFDESKIRRQCINCPRDKIVCDQLCNV